MLHLTKIQRLENLRKYSFEEYSRPGYCIRAVTIITDSFFEIKALRFNSAHHGVVAFSQGRGLTESVAWQDESQARAVSGHQAYYTVSGLTSMPADAEAVIADVLSAAPTTAFKNLILNFTADTTQQLIYPCQNFRLEVPKTSGQIRVLRLRKDQSAAKSETTIRTWQELRHDIKYKIRSAIDRIEYQCESCLKINPFLAKECWDCHAPRPKIGWHEILVLLLRVMIRVTYVIYILLALGFLFAAYLVTLRLMRPY